MVPLTSHFRFATVPRQLGLGVALSAGIHLLSLAALFLLVTRPGSPSPETGAAEGEVVIDLSTGDQHSAEPGPRLDESGPDRDNRSPAGERAGSGRPSGTMAPTGAPAAASGARQVATAAVPAPAVARPVSPRATATATTRTRASGASRRSPRVAARASLPAETAAPPEKVEPLVPTEKPAQQGTPGPSPRSIFLAHMKKQLRASWRAAEVYLRIDPQGRLQGSMLVTALQVRLRADGTVEKSQLSDSSGIRDLDVEAMSVMERVKTLGQVPAELLDAQGGFDVRCSFHLDVGLYRFANQLHHAIAQEWRPSKAYASTMAQERKTIVRLMLTRDGALTEAKVMASAGIDFLDQGAISWARPGMKFPPPPPAFGRGEGPFPIFVAFLHLTGEPRVLKPREDLEAE
jgi:TonB family protein